MMKSVQQRDSGQVMCAYLKASLERHIHERPCFTTFPNTEKRDQKLLVAEYFEELRGAWKCDETLSRFFNVSSRSKLTLMKNGEAGKMVKRNKQTNTVAVADFLP